MVGLLKRTPDEVVVTDNILNSIRAIDEAISDAGGAQMYVLSIQAVASELANQDEDAIVGLLTQLSLIPQTHLGFPSPGEPGIAALFMFTDESVAELLNEPEGLAAADEGDEEDE